MTTYNGMPFVRSAIQSITEQTTSCWKLVIVDDGSTDGTREWLRTFGDPRIRVIELSKNMGQTTALNHGLSVVDTEFVARLDQDDLASCDRIASQLSYLDEHPGVVLVSGWAYLIDDDGSTIGEFAPAGSDATTLRYLIECDRPNPIAHSAATFRTEFARVVGGYPGSIQYANDYGLWCGLSREGRIIVEERFVGSLRQHKGQTSTGVVPLISRREVLEYNKSFGESIELTVQQRRKWRASRRSYARKGIGDFLFVAIKHHQLRWSELRAFCRVILG
jgi:glycosyltransferase involved in cell wall biosynthesis